jgi:hypothetical protein
MAFARYLYRLLLGAWMGALLCFGAIVAPALFRELTPEFAGAVVRRIIPALDVAGMAAGLGLLGLGLWVEGAPRKRAAVRAALLGVMLLAAGTSYFVLRPRLAQLRGEAPAKMSELPKDHPVRREFGRLHGLSTFLMLGELVCGLVALGLPLRPKQDEADVAASPSLAG